MTDFCSVFAPNFEPRKPPKSLNLYRFYIVFLLSVFKISWIFAPILVLTRRHFRPKNQQKNEQKSISRGIKKQLILGSFFRASKPAQDGRKTAHDSDPSAKTPPRASQDGPRGLQDAPKRPKRPSKRPQMAPGRPQEAPKTAHDGPRRAKLAPEGPKMLQEILKTSRGRPRRRSRGTKRPPKVKKDKVLHRNLWCRSIGFLFILAP